MLLKSSVVHTNELDELLRKLPGDLTSLRHDATLKIWQQWHQQGSLLLGRVDAFSADGNRQLCALGVTLWITDEAVQALEQGATHSCTHRIYHAAAQGLRWVMQTSDIEHAHKKSQLNLMVLHFWLATPVTDPAFQSVFLHTSALFKELHQGFGVQRLVQEVVSQHVPLLEAGGMHVVHQSRQKNANEMPQELAWMQIRALDAQAHQGSTFSFLFFSPQNRLKLKPVSQRMLLLALRQRTDEDIAGTLGCTRDYVRKIWTDVYLCLEDAGAIDKVETTTDHPESTNSANPKRGRERRRAALEFLRANPHELRPGLPTKLRV